MCLGNLMFESVGSVELGLENHMSESENDFKYV